MKGEFFFKNAATKGENDIGERLSINQHFTANGTTENYGVKAQDALGVSGCVGDAFKDVPRLLSVASEPVDCNYDIARREP